MKVNRRDKSPAPIKDYTPEGLIANQFNNEL